MKNLSEIGRKMSKKFRASLQSSCSKKKFICEGGGRQVLNTDLEQNLFDQITSKRSINHQVTRKFIMDTAIKMIQSEQYEKFK